CPLPATVVFNYPTVDRLADYLMGGTVEARPPAPAQAVMEARELMAGLPLLHQAMLAPAQAVMEARELMALLAKEAGE
ncbi:MAG: hypothetical protein NTV52_03185, partial [Acidobacteria bacterium]|nr:hypothetical protein [Acidobacteriota bacterium]